MNIRMRLRSRYLGIKTRYEWWSDEEHLNWNSNVHYSKFKLLICKWYYIIGWFRGLYREDETIKDITGENLSLVKIRCFWAPKGISIYSSKVYDKS